MSAEKENRTEKNHHTEDMHVLVHPGAIATEFFLGILAAGYDMTLLSGVLLFLALAGGISHMWARLSIRKLRFSLSVDSSRLFPGSETILRYRFDNDKLLPLLWLEAVHSLPENTPLAPLDLKLDTLSNGVVPAQKLPRRFSFVMWHQSLSWEEPWLALHRGIYKLNAFVSTGDPLGFIPHELSLDASSRRTIAVYPKLVPVDVRMMLQNQWNAQSGSKGHTEDPTIIRATRPYEPSDSARRINWRLAARGQQLSVNRFETIMPKSVHFILDSESFNGFVPYTAEWENSISVLASCLMALDNAGVGCGLSLHKMPDLSARNLLAIEGAQLSDMLFALASVSFCELLPVKANVNADPRLDRVAPTVFSERELSLATHSIGHFYYVAYDLDHITGRSFLSHLDPSVTTILVAKEPCEHSSGILGAFDVVPISHLQKGGDAK
ncbi:MAG: DUF58 domain-containing protein [Oscillospiraceae bacterium]|nr:DUF58 domain-containing protein [Oscillospiraceae bacterium]